MCSKQEKNNENCDIYINKGLKIFAASRHAVIED